MSTHKKIILYGFFLLVAFHLGIFVGQREAIVLPAPPCRPAVFFPSTPGLFSPGGTLLYYLDADGVTHNVWNR